MSMRPVSILGLFAVLAGGCKPAVLRVAEDPRFVHDQADPLPGLRPHYPAEFTAEIASAVARCNPNPIAGMDVLLNYLTQRNNQGPTERFVQRIRSTDTVWATVNACGDTPTDRLLSTIEVFDPGQAWDLITLHSCQETRISSIIEGEVGLVDLEDLPAAIEDELTNHPDDPNANVLIIGIENLETGILNMNPQLAMTPPDRDAIEQAAAANFKITWRIHYQYDGCNGHGQRTTGCGPNAIHCLRLRAKDSEGSRTRTFQR